MSRDRPGDTPTRAPADIVDLAAVRQARGAPPATIPPASVALAGALRRAAADLVAQMAMLDQRAHALAASTRDLSALNHRLGTESERSRAIAVQADRIATAIDAGDLARLEILQQELLQLAREQPLVLDGVAEAQRAMAVASSARNCGP